MDRIRYAVVGAGHIAQNAVIPAFRHAAKNSELTALFSDDPKKRKVLGKRLGIGTFSYDDFDRACRSDQFDAVYIALPNTMHREYTERAAAAGIHVLCEKPMATTARDCRAMIEACQSAEVRLMIAYRLHFEPANLEAVKIARSGKLGELRAFHSVFAMQVRAHNIRTDAAMGGGPLYDIGIYCINAARSLFGENPVEVTAASVQGPDPRFREVEEAASVIMRFPGERIASFTCSFGTADTGWYELLGTRGELCLDSAYEYEGSRELAVYIGEKSRTRTFRPCDQFAPELIAFSNSIRRGVDPEPDGMEGLIDVRIIEAAFESADTGRTIRLDLPADRPVRPSQAMKSPPVRNKRLVHANSGHRD